MTVVELIAKLLEYPPDHEVWISQGYEDPSVTVGVVETWPWDKGKVWLLE